MVKVFTGPVQLLAVGVTVTVATTGVVPAFVAVKELIALPDPEAPSPMEGVLFVQVNVVPATVLVNDSRVVPAPLQTVWSPGVALAIGVGLTVMVNVADGPAQLFAVGVTVNVAVTGVDPLLVAVKEGIALPDPLAPMPIVILLFVQVYVVPATLLVNISVVVLALLHTVWLVGVTVIFGVGLTVIVNVDEAPVQLLAVGVTVIVATTGAAPLLVAVKEAILPAPEAARPIEVVLFVQLNTVPLTAPLNVSVVVAAPLQTVWVPGDAETVGVGLTVMVNVADGPAQLFAVGVTVNVAVTGVDPLLVAVKEGIALPDPLAPMPMVILLFVQVYVVPATLLINISVVVLALLHTVWLVGVTVIFGVGLTVIVKVEEAPVQLLAVGVTVIVATTGAAPLLVAVKEAILPVPEAARPIEVVLLVQENTVPLTAPVNVSAVVAAPLHTVWVPGEALTVGVGFTVIVKLVDVPEQVTPALV
jgi:predicted membrane protein